jgi:hypothetical protein
MCSPVRHTVKPCGRGNFCACAEYGGRVGHPSRQAGPVRNREVRVAATHIREIRCKNGRTVMTVLCEIRSHNYAQICNKLYTQYFDVFQRAVWCYRVKELTGAVR